MTPKEKAEELINKHLDCYSGRHGEDFDYKKSVLITIDEVIQDYTTGRNSDNYDFWIKVREEVVNQ